MAESFYENYFLLSRQDLVPHHQQEVIQLEKWLYGGVITHPGNIANSCTTPIIFFEFHSGSASKTYGKIAISATTSFQTKNRPAICAVSSLRKHPFLLALRRWGRFGLAKNIRSPKPHGRHSGSRVLAIRVRLILC